MSRYAAMFERLGRVREGAFVPFCVLGDPTPSESAVLVATLAAAGADALELGIPFSDPIADGPTIQAANARALAAGVRPDDAFAIVAALRAAHPELPIGLLVYANLIEARGQAFYGRAAAAGVDSVLVADVPTLESPPFVAAATAAGIEPVLIATPDARPHELAQIARESRGYTYVVSRRGVTGEDRPGAGVPSAIFAALRAAGAPPGLLGFGIGEPGQIRAALAAGAAGAISGSAVVARIERHIGDLGAACRALTDFVQRMKAATALSEDRAGPHA